MSCLVDVLESLLHDDVPHVIGLLRVQEVAELLLAQPLVLVLVRQVPPPPISVLHLLVALLIGANGSKLLPRKTCLLLIGLITSNVYLETLVTLSRKLGLIQCNEA